MGQIEAEPEESYEDVTKPNRCPGANVIKLICAYNVVECYILF